MEYTPEIAAALDIYAEESTTPNEDGFILQIYSESKRIKSVLADLFNNSLDINTNLPMWTRNTCKYGDNFIYLRLDPEKGVIGSIQLPNIEIERYELGMSERMGTSNIKTPDNSKGLKFTWKSRNIDFSVILFQYFLMILENLKFTVHIRAL